MLKISLGVTGGRQNSKLVRGTPDPSYDADYNYFVFLYDPKQDMLDWVLYYSRFEIIQERE